MEERREGEERGKEEKGRRERRTVESGLEKGGRLEAENVCS